MGVILRKPRGRKSASSGGSYQWYKIAGPSIFISSGRYLWELMEIKINGASPSAAYGISSHSGVWTPSNAIDGSLVTGWLTADHGEDDTLWLAVQMSSATTLSKLSLYPQSTTGETHLCPTGFNLYGSNDSTNGSDGTWTLIASGLTRSDDTVRWHEWTF